MSTQARCSHPGCDRTATEIAVVESAWEDTARGSALMVCSDHADRYLGYDREAPPLSGLAGPSDAVLRAHRRGPDR
jgi:hypothetical protein